MKNKFLILLHIIFAFYACGDDSGGEDVDHPQTFEISSASVGSIDLIEGEVVEDIPVDAFITISFSQNVGLTALESALSLTQGTSEINYTLTQTSGAVYEIIPDQNFRANSSHSIAISEELVSVDGATFAGASYQFRTQSQSLNLNSVFFGEVEGLGEDRVTDVSLNLDLTLSFTSAIDAQALSSTLSIGSGYSLTFTQKSDTAVLVTTESELPPLRRFVLSISDNLVGANGEEFLGFAQEFYTQIDSTYKFPELSDEELLTKVQEQTFKYFWDFAHPVSGLARERNTSGNTVTIGGSGFGVMALLVGIERGFITRQEGIDRLETIVDFLSAADRFHGVWPHWMDGNTGEVIPFSEDDNGGDLVETAFMIEGLLTVRAYLNPDDAQEADIIDSITTLWEEVEWDWYTQGGQDVLYWHWSPTVGWQKNLQIKGWNESLMVYVLAASSPTHSVETDVYDEGWASSGGMVNGNEFYDITLPLGSDYGGPLFFAHYSFLGLDPRSLEDQYANYWEQNVSHARINQAYCIDNPGNYVGYNENNWGLTASDGNNGYSAHSPTNDRGVITPTAAISSIPYTPDESMAAIKHFYYLLGDKVWGEYGFYDAFNITENWYADSFLAIDQGPIIIMIENYRSQLLWEEFMSDTDVQAGLDKLGFTYE